MMSSQRMRQAMRIVPMTVLALLNVSRFFQKPAALAADQCIGSTHFKCDIVHYWWGDVASCKGQGGGPGYLACKAEGWFPPPSDCNHCYTIMNTQRCGEWCS